MAIKYEVIGLEKIVAEKLKKHPDAQLPIGENDLAALSRSIEENGLLLPLLVLADADKDGKFWVVDGCNRLDQAADDDELSCILIRTDSPRAVALECMAAGRPRTAGQRIMAYLERHRDMVLKAAELGQEAKGGNSFGVSRDTPKLAGVFANFSSDAIANRLSVSKKDVLLGIDLLVCLEKKKTTPIRVGSMVEDSRPLDMKNKDDVAYYNVMQHTHARIFAGETPIRRWKSAVAGKVTQAEGRTEIDYADLFVRGLQHIRSASKKWDEITFDDRKYIVKLAAEVGEILPADIRKVM
jgi:hypothetical protein